VTSEFRRLGKDGAYRLGQLGAQGISDIGKPAPFRPSFARSHRRGPASAWLLALVLAAVVIAGAAELGWWFMPFVAGLAVGVANRIAGWRTRIALPAVIAMALAGWGAPLVWQSLRNGQSYRAVTRQVAVQLGLPTHSSAWFALILAIAAAQAAIGYWLGRALTPRPVDE
jgi:hypothetical protein